MKWMRLVWCGLDFGHHACDVCAVLYCVGRQSMDLCDFFVLESYMGDGCGGDKGGG